MAAYQIQFKVNGKVYANIDDAETAKSEAMVDLSEIIRESEKAIMIAVEVECVHTHKITKVDTWFPKSQVNNHQVKGWLAVKKRREIRNNFNSDVIVHI